MSDGSCSVQKNGNNKKIKLAAVVGPTASGKTALSVELARRFSGEVVSCDSMQVYSELKIATARPDDKEMRGVAHHLLGYVSLDEEYSVARYVEDATAAVKDITSRGKLPVLCGGTGLYADSLLLGRSFAPCPSTGMRETLEAEARQSGIEPLLARLKEVDPEAGARLHPSDKRRIIRALEVYLETGETISEHNRKTKLLPPKHEAVWIGLSFENRQDLYDRIDLRVERMLQDGLLDEIRALLASGISPAATAMQAIGYKEYVDCLTAGGDVHAATALVQQRSRNYAKRQLTWLRRNEQIHWILQPREPDFAAVFRQACTYIPFFA